MRHLTQDGAELDARASNKNIGLKGHRNVCNFPFAPHNPTLSRCSRVKVENSKLGCPRSRSRFPQGRGDRRGVFRRKKCIYSRAGRCSRKGGGISAARRVVNVSHGNIAVSMPGDTVPRSKARVSSRPWEWCHMCVPDARVREPPLIVRVATHYSKARKPKRDSSRKCFLISGTSYPRT